MNLRRFGDDWFSWGIIVACLSCFAIDMLTPPRKMPNDSFVVPADSQKVVLIKNGRNWKVFTGNGEGVFSINNTIVLKVQ